MSHEQLLNEACACIIDALGLQLEPNELSFAVLASVREKRKLGRYGIKQNEVEYIFERMERP